VTSYQNSVSLELPFAEAVAATTAALAEQGFGILTQIDVQATMKTKRDKDMEPYVILGACNPALAEQAIDADRSTGVLLPCNVVVRGDGNGNGSIVSFLDPQLMAAVTDLPAMTALANEATTRLDAALATLATLAPHSVEVMLKMQHQLDVANDCHPSRPNA
jgi:uncharacterized protein (DUF302 family)